MSESTKLRYELFSAWSGALLILLYVFCWTGIAKVQPPLPYSATPADAAHFYLSRQMQIMVGMAASAITGGAAGGRWLSTRGAASARLSLARPGTVCAHVTLGSASNVAVSERITAVRNTVVP